MTKRETSRRREEVGKARPITAARETIRKRRKTHGYAREIMKERKEAKKWQTR